MLVAHVIGGTSVAAIASSDHGASALVARSVGAGHTAKRMLRLAFLLLLAACAARKSPFVAEAPKRADREYDTNKDGKANVFEFGPTGKTTRRELDLNHDGRIDIVCSDELVVVSPVPRRGHQGWRYLEAEISGEADPSGVADLPPRLYGKLAALALV